MTASKLNRDRRASIVFTLFFFLAQPGLFAEEKQSLAGGSDEPPNFIVILTDDQGYGDLGCYGSPNIVTPHIDRLAAGGMRFTSFYAAPFCSPSRAQLLTGSYPARVSHAFNQGPGSKTGLNPDEFTVAEVLKQRGYATLHIGKWHLGDAPEFLPTRQGFDQFFGLPYSHDMWKYHPNMPVRPDEDVRMQSARKRAAYTGFAQAGKPYPENFAFLNPLPLMRGEKAIEEDPDLTQLTTRYTEAALQFISENRHRPFFLYLAHAMPHVPLFVSKKFEGQSERGLYGDVLMEIDWSTGQIMAKLEELDLSKKTVIVFTSDNGPWRPYGIDAGSSGPLRGDKGTVFEGGVRVPGIVAWQGHILPGQRSSAIAGTLDLLPTFAALAGAELPADRVLDGRNLWPLLSGQSPESPHDYFYYFAGTRKGVNLKAVRDRRWKLFISTDPDGVLSGTELYDLAWDVMETRNRIEDHPEIAMSLQRQAQAFYDQMVREQRPVGILGKERAR